MCIHTNMLGMVLASMPACQVHINNNTTPALRGMSRNCARSPQIVEPDDTQQGSQVDDPSVDATILVLQARVRQGGRYLAGRRSWWGA